MRNYIQTFWKLIEVTADDGVNPPLTLFLKPFGGTKAAVAVSEAAGKQNIIDSFPGYTITFANRLETFPAWFLFDKENVVKMMTAISDFFFDQCLLDPLANFAPIEPSKQLLGATLTESPRKKGWTDSDGNKRAPTPSDKGVKGVGGDFSGVQGLIDVLNVLPAYAESLRRQGRKRDAGIVLDVYNRIIAGTLSIPDGLQILRDNNL